MTIEALAADTCSSSSSSCRSTGAQHAAVKHLQAYTQLPA
jgi:hypothetical protein